MKNNARLQKMFEADQKDRTGQNRDWFVIAKNDEKRRKAVSRMIEKNQLKTAADYYHAALIFQHATNIEGIREAKKFAATAMHKGDERAKWLYAAATDRLLVQQNKIQKFGTQYWQSVSETGNGRTKRTWVLYPYDERTTDHMRVKYNVPKLKDLKKGPRYKPD